MLSTWKGKLPPFYFKFSNCCKQLLHATLINKISLKSLLFQDSLVFLVLRVSYNSYNYLFFINSIIIFSSQTKGIYKRRVSLEFHTWSLGKSSKKFVESSTMLSSSDMEDRTTTRLQTCLMQLTTNIQKELDASLTNNIQERFWISQEGADGHGSYRKFFLNQNKGSYSQYSCSMRLAIIYFSKQKLLMYIKGSIKRRITFLFIILLTMLKSR